MLYIFFNGNVYSQFPEEIICGAPGYIPEPPPYGIPHKNGPNEELNADKDIEDARYLYKLFKEKINKQEMIVFINKLNVMDKFRFLE